MKIHLSKEHIEKGFKLILPEKAKNYESHYQYIKDPNTPEYRDFLQLVIEAINKSESKNKIVQTWSCIKIIYKSKKLEYVSKTERFPFSAYTITEAKEKSISYVFDNMEVLK